MDPTPFVLGGLAGFAAGYVLGRIRARSECNRLRETYPGPPVMNDKGDIEVIHPWQLADALNRPQKYQTKPSN